MERKRVKNADISKNKEIKRIFLLSAVKQEALLLIFWHEKSRHPTKIHQIPGSFVFIWKEGQFLALASAEATACLIALEE